MDLARVDVTSSITLARDRSLPLDEVFATLLPEPGLIRGRIVECTGGAATSLALALAARATVTGSWLAVVGIAPIGIEAARELGVAIDRLVSIDADACRPDEWADRVAATADGFELILTMPPTGSSTGSSGRVERVIRKIRQRVQARGAVLLIVSASGRSRAGADVVLEVTAGEWEGLGEGHGHLHRRRVVVRAGGRRIPRQIERELWLPGVTGRPESIEPAAATVPAVSGVGVELERAG
jgi:hypothetical protein